MNQFDDISGVDRPDSTDGLRDPPPREEGEQRPRLADAECSAVVARLRERFSFGG